MCKSNSASMLQSKAFMLHKTKKILTYILKNCTAKIVSKETLDLPDRYSLCRIALVQKIAKCDNDSKKN